MATKGNGTREDPWLLKTPPGSSEFTASATRHSIRPRSSSRSVRPSSGTTCAAWMICTRCSKSTATGCCWGRRRAETCGRWHRRGVGPLEREPDRRMVRPQEGLARPVRDVRAAGDGGARAGRGRAQPPEQPDALALAARSSSRRPPAVRGRRAAARRGALRIYEVVQSGRARLS